MPPSNLMQILSLLLYHKLTGLFHLHFMHLLFAYLMLNFPIKTLLLIYSFLQPPYVYYYLYFNFVCVKFKCYHSEKNNLLVKKQLTYSTAIGNICFLVAIKKVKPHSAKPKWCLTLFITIFFPQSNLSPYRHLHTALQGQFLRYVVSFHTITLLKCAHLMHRLGDQVKWHPH